MVSRSIWHFNTVCIVIAVIISLIFGLCALCGYPLKCCKTTEAPPRRRQVQPVSNIPINSTSPAANGTNKTKSSYYKL